MIHNALGKLLKAHTSSVQGHGGTLNCELGMNAVIIKLLQLLNDHQLEGWRLLRWCHLMRSFWPQGGFWKCICFNVFPFTLLLLFFLLWWCWMPSHVWSNGLKCKAFEDALVDALIIHILDVQVLFLKDVFVHNSPEISVIEVKSHWRCSCLRPWKVNVVTITSSIVELLPVWQVIKQLNKLNPFVITGFEANTKVFVFSEHNLQPSMSLLGYPELDNHITFNVCNCIPNLVCKHEVSSSLFSVDDNLLTIKLIHCPGAWLLEVGHEQGQVPDIVIGIHNCRSIFRWWHHLMSCLSPDNPCLWCWSFYNLHLFIIIRVINHFWNHWRSTHWWSWGHGVGDLRLPLPDGIHDQVNGTVLQALLHLLALLLIIMFDACDAKSQSLLQDLMPWRFLCLYLRWSCIISHHSSPLCNQLSCQLCPSVLALDLHSTSHCQSLQVIKGQLSQLINGWGSAIILKLIGKHITSLHNLPSLDHGNVPEEDQSLATHCCRTERGRVSKGCKFLTKEIDASLKVKK